MRHFLIFCLLVQGVFLASTGHAAEMPGAEEFEAQGAIIGEIVFEKSNVFDLSDPKENKAFYRLANLIHVVTKDKVIEKQLLFKSGDPYSRRLVE